MTTKTNLRMKEIQSIWQQYQGLYVVGGILIGLLLFPFFELVINDLSHLLIGLLPEAIGIGFTVFFLDRIYQKREVEQLTRRLIREAGGQSNETAKSAVDWLRHEGWLTGDSGLLKYAKLGDANLEGAKLGGANLIHAKLKNAKLEHAKLFGANLEGADLGYANLKYAKLRNANLERVTLFRSNLEGADLDYANLKYAKLRNANLDCATLFGANLEGADLRNANLEGADLRNANLVSGKLRNIILPDGTKWTTDTDISRFTNQTHPDFWKPPKNSL